MSTTKTGSTMSTGSTGSIDPASAGQAADARNCAGRLLIVDDEPNILELLSASLRFAGFEVMTAASGKEALAVAGQARPDLIVLDIMLPDIDGLAVADRLRGDGPRIPVLFLSARDAPEDKIAGLSQADDYVTKPFSLEEVLARVRAVLRRTRGEDTPVLLEVGDLVMDEEARQVWRAGRPVRLSPTEFKLLHYFMVNQGRVLSKAQILDHVWHYDFGGDGNVVESYVSYLRRKIDRTEPKLIHTIRGVGYVLRPPRA